MKTTQINQLSGIEVLSVETQYQIKGGKHGWYKKLFKRNKKDDKSKNDDNKNHDSNDDHGHHGNGHG